MPPQVIEKRGEPNNTARTEREPILETSAQFDRHTSDRASWVAVPNGEKASKSSEVAPQWV